MGGPGEPTTWSGVSPAGRGAVRLSPGCRGVSAQSPVREVNMDAVSVQFLILGVCFCCIAVGLQSGGREEEEKKKKKQECNRINVTAAVLTHESLFVNTQSLETGEVQACSCSICPQTLRAFILCVCTPAKITCYPSRIFCPVALWKHSFNPPNYCVDSYLSIYLSIYEKRDGDVYLYLKVCVSVSATAVDVIRLWSIYLSFVIFGFCSYTN